MISFLRAKITFYIFVSPVPSTVPDTKQVGRKCLTGLKGGKSCQIFNHSKQSASVGFPSKSTSYLKVKL